MEADRATDSARPSGHAVTVRIPPAHSAVSTPHSDTVTATDTPSQPAPSDALRQAPGATPAVPPLPTPSEPFAEFAAETAASERSAAETHDPALDLSSIELEPVPTPTDAGADALDVLPLPESLSLDELLGVGADAPLATLSASPPEPDTPASEPVFELTESDAPPLPMVEAGTGEPPALAVEHLLGTGAAAPEDTLTLELPELDLTALSGVPSSLPAEDTVFGTTPSEATAEPAEVLGVDPSAAERAAAAMETMFAPVPPDVALLGDAAEVVPGAPEPGLSDKPFELAGARAEELSVAAPEVAAGAGAPSPGASGAFAPEEMAAMRDAVTARVADELRHELNEKLLERFEKIVWEVVPDLAEILITKEIERIRRLADEERKS